MGEKKPCISRHRLPESPDLIPSRLGGGYIPLIIAFQEMSSEVLLALHIGDEAPSSVPAPNNIEPSNRSTTPRPPWVWDIFWFAMALSLVIGYSLWTINECAGKTTGAAKTLRTYVVLLAQNLASLAVLFVPPSLCPGLLMAFLSSGIYLSSLGTGFSTFLLGPGLFRLCVLRAIAGPIALAKPGNCHRGK